MYRERNHNMVMISPNKDKSSVPSSSKSMTKQQNNSQSKETPAVKKTPTRIKFPDIRAFYNPITGKRKTTDTTPKKSTNEKKTNKKTMMNSWMRTDMST